MIHRRKILTGAAAFGFAAPTLARSAEKKGGFKADLVVRNSLVYTSDPGRPKAQSFAVANGRFIAVGDDADIEGLVGPGTTVIEARGQFVFPGFIDAHSHPSSIQEVYGAIVGFATIAEIKSAMRAKAKETPPGFWVEGYMYDDKKLDGGNPITRFDLDEAVPDHPAIVRHRGGHTGVVNSKALELAGVTDETPDPEGGAYYRDGGVLNGRVAEKAMFVFEKVGKRTPVTRAMQQEGVKRISKRMAAAGVTSVTNAFGEVEEIIAYQDARKAGEMYFRLCFMPGGGSPAYAGLKAAGISTGFGDEWLRIGAVKFAADGSASERTMRMSTPFKGRPDDYGILTMSAEEIFAAVNDARDHDFQIGIHANGDVTIAMVLDAYEKVLKEKPLADPRYRIEHCTLINEKLLKRIKKIGAVPTPFYTYAHYHGDKWDEYGEQKLEHMFAHRSFLDHGIMVAPASDYPPGPFEPLMAIQSMATRKDLAGKVWGPSQKISVADAVKICTMHGAYASFEENIKGSIASGKLADFVMLARDPFSEPADSIKTIPVIRTVVGGNTVFEA
ncbi:MAG: amidohydrolase [Parvularculaceae bacterium]